LTLLALAYRSLAEAYARALERARRLALELLTPSGPIPRSAVESLYRRALRNGAWRRMPQLHRSLLAAAARARVAVYRSRILVEVLRQIWLEVEEATARGRAVVAALAQLLARGGQELLEAARRGLDHLIAIGLQALNTPLPGPG
jgi:hypothetical protein